MLDRVGLWSLLLLLLLFPRLFLRVALAHSTRSVPSELFIFIDNFIVDVFVLFLGSWTCVWLSFCFFLLTSGFGV